MQVPDAHFIDVQIADSARADQLQPLDAHLPEDLGKDAALEGGPDLPCLDSDGDGFCSNVDCLDNDPSSYPGAPELCDGKDNNCNGPIDEGCCTTCIDTKTGKCVTTATDTLCGTKGDDCKNCVSVGMSCSAAGTCYAP